MPIGATMLPELDQAAQQMPFDQFGRYHMLREALDACREHLNQATLSVLDVGGIYVDNGTPRLPIMPFLPDDKVTVLDILECDLPGYVKGDGTSLNYPDQFFDFVVTCDTLEHIPQDAREAFWNELLRVAKHGVILLAPFGNQQVELAEEILFRYIKNELHATQEQLQEHVEYGLPRLDKWLDFLAQQDIKATSFPTGYLPAWLGMMMIKHMMMKIDQANTAQASIDYLYNIQYFPTERRNPAYRHLIIAEHTAGLVAAVEAVLKPTLMPDQADLSADWSHATTMILNAITQRHIALDKAQQATQAELTHNHYEHMFNAYKNNIEDYKIHIGNYQQSISSLERILADQQIQINLLTNQLSARQVAHEQTHHHHAMAMHTVQDLLLEKEQLEHAIEDLKQRSMWLESTNKELSERLQRVENGTVLRVLNKLT